MTGALALKPILSETGIEHKFSEQRQKFLSLFPNRARHIRKKSADPEWTTVKGPLFSGLIDAAISAKSDTFFGAYWGPHTQFAVLDIDKSSKYHNVQELKPLRQSLSECGLETTLYQSSNSGGWHLYIFFTQWETSAEVGNTLKHWLKALGYEIKGGQLEVFPSGCALRLPLQPGFAWLAPDASVIRRREETPLNEALAYFVEDQEANAQNWQIAKSLMESQISGLDRAAGRHDQAHQKRLEIGGFEDLYCAGRIEEIWDKGRKWWQEGLASKGERHNAVLAVGHYLWYGDSENGIAALPGARNDEYRARLIEQWLIEKHNGFCRHIDQDKWDVIKAQIRRAVLWRGDGLARDYEPYRLTDRLLKRLLALFHKTGKVWTVEDLKQANDDRQEEAREKIRAALAQCFQEGRQISRSTLQKVTGCSPNTLKKHSDLWKLFALGSGEYNRGGSGGRVLDFPSSGSFGVEPDFEEEQKEEKEFLELESSSQPGCVLDSLRYDRTGQTATNSRQVTTEVLAAVHPIQSNYGVKHELAGFAPCVASGGIACGINGFLPTASQRVPSIYSSAVFSTGAPAQNLRQVGDRFDGSAYKAEIARVSGVWIRQNTHAQELDRTKILVMPSGRAFGCVPLSCYDKRRQRAGGRFESPAYIALLSSRSLQMTLGRSKQLQGDSSRLKVDSVGYQVQKQAENLERLCGHKHRCSLSIDDSS